MVDIRIDTKFPPFKNSSVFLLERAGIASTFEWLSLETDAFWVQMV